MSTEKQPDIDIRDLRVTFGTRRGRLQAVDGVSLQVQAGECLGVVGESGSGKTMLAMSVLGLVPKAAEVSGEVRVAGLDTLSATRQQLDRLRAHELGLVMQDPTPSLNPLRRISSQLQETARAAGLPRGERNAAIQRCLREAELDPGEVRSRYPFELSGGMNQRVAIAMALLHEPRVLVADEPTTALDVTTQAALLNTIARIRREQNMTVVIVSHDLAVVSQVADRVAVMYAGCLLELGPTQQVISSPQQPYTQALLGALPTVGRGREQQLTTIEGSLAPRFDDSVGCPFATRCVEVRDECRHDNPPHVRFPGRHEAWCFARQEQPGPSRVGSEA